MKALFIGGTGNISFACAELAIKKGWDLYILNRGSGKGPGILKGINWLVADINNEQYLKEILKGHKFDVVVNFIAFKAKDIERDYRLFRDITKQYIFISSASCYQKPVLNPVITESTPLKNPFWQYARDKIACEDVLMNYYRNKNYPITIIRPSLTYNTVIPVPIGGWKNYNVVERIKNRKPIIVHGDGTSPWVVTHAKDFAIGLVGLMGQSKAIGHAFHITTDEVLTWGQMYISIGMAVGEMPNIVHISSDKIIELSQELGGPDMTGTLLGDKAWGILFDNTKIKSFVPEFKATIRFEEGIKSTIEWFESVPGRKNIDIDVEKWIDAMITNYK